MEDNQVQQPQINNQIEPTPSFLRRWLLMIVGIAIVVFAGGGVLAYQVWWSSSSTSPSKESPIGTTPTGFPRETSGSTDCGPNFDCFIDSAESCKKSSVERILELDIFGYPLAIKESYKLRGWVDEKCLLSFTIETSTASITQECSFDDTKPLTSSLEAWKGGNSSGWVLNDYCVIVDTNYITQDLVTITPKEPLSEIEVNDFPVKDNLPSGWQIISDTILLRSENPDRYKNYEGHDGYKDYEGLIAERQINIGGAGGVLANISIVELDSVSNAANFYKDSRFIYTSNIIGSKCSFKGSKGYAASCFSVQKQRYYVHVSVNVLGDAFNPLFTEERNKGSSFLQTLLNAI